MSQKIVKNTTGLDIDVFETGVTLFASSSYTIPPEDYEDWAREETITELTVAINSGDIVVNDGNKDLAPSVGIKQLGIFNFADFTDRLTVNQPSHGFTLPSYGVLPIYYNNVAGEYQEAQADDIQTSADAVVVEIIDANNFIIQESGFVEVTHGLTPGQWYVLDPNNPGEAVSYTTLSGVDVNVQYLFFTVSATQIQLKNDPIFTRDFFIPQDISLLEDWTQGSMPPLTAGTDRLLIAGVAFESAVSSTVTNMSIGGETGTLLIEQYVTSGFTAGFVLWYWTDTQINNMTNNTLSVTYSSAVLDDQQLGCIIEHADQVTPTVDTNTDSGTGFADTLTVDHNTLAGGYSIIGSAAGNDPTAFTNSNGSYTRKLNLTITSADGVLDDYLVNADQTPENVDISVSGSNRHVAVGASIRRRES